MPWSDLLTIFLSVTFLYALVTGVFLISENRRPQSTMAWLLAFYFAPIVGVAIYFLFGRHRKAFSRQSKLLVQDLAPSAQPILSSLKSRQDAMLEALERRSPAHQKLMTLVRRNSNSALTSRNQVEIQQDATVFYPRLLEDLRAAGHSIHLQYYIWRSDDFSAQVRDALIAKARAGIEVRLLYDAIGSLGRFSRRDIREMRQAGIAVAPTSPLYHLHTIGYRNHRKITVIDGRIGYTGGMNIGHEHLDGGAGFDSWRDTQLRIVGEGAAVLQAVFLVDWYNAVRENLFSDAYFPAETVELPAAEVPVQILTSGPDSQWSAIRQLYSNMIVNAQRHVYLQSPYFVLDGTIAEALTSAALSGIDVQVMLSSRASGNVLPNWAGNTYITDVVAAGVRVFFYEKGYLHAKTISIDSKICSIGSANIDIRSFSINYELNAVIYHEQLATEVEQAFLHDRAFCTEFNVDEYERRNVAVRFRDSVARLLSPLL